MINSVDSQAYEYRHVYKEEKSVISPAFSELTKLKDAYFYVKDLNLVFTPEERAWLDSQERSLEAIQKEAKNSDLLDKLLQDVKKKSKEIAKRTSLPYERIDANLVSYPEQDYIMSKQPMTASEQDKFWQTLFYFHSSIIVAVLIPNEDGKNHELGYLASIPEPVSDRWLIEQEGEEVLKQSTKHTTCQIVKRLLRITDKICNDTRTITHFHYEGWPNKKGAPDCELFTFLLDAVDEAHQEPTTPITVHCTAGVGRSGTFVASHVLKQQKAPYNIADVLMHGRLQRDGFVETKSQMQTIYRSLSKE